MAPGSYACRSPYINTPANLARELDEFASQGPARGSNVGSDEAFTKAPNPPEATTLPLILPPSKDLFTIFMKAFMETTQAQVQALAELQERPSKIRTPKTYFGKSHMDCYHYC